MAIFIRLARLTEKGNQNIRNLDQMVADAMKIMEEHGAKILHTYTILGEYDMISVVEAPDDKIMTRISALIAQQGNFRAETLPALPMDEFIRNIKL